jgi:hypothetical protein
MNFVLFAWGFIKDVVYSRKVRDLADLRQRVSLEQLSLQHLTR